MKNENAFVGQVDLMALLGANLKVVDAAKCIVIPIKLNPTIELYQRKNGRLSAFLNIFMNSSEGKFGNSHYMRATISKKALERHSMTCEDARRFCPIVGNMKPVPCERTVIKQPSREFNNYYSYTPKNQ